MWRGPRERLVSAKRKENNHVDGSIGKRGQEKVVIGVGEVRPECLALWFVLRSKESLKS